MLNGSVVKRGGELVDAACLVDGEITGSVVGEVPRAVNHVDLDARTRRQNITAAEWHTVCQQ